VLTHYYTLQSNKRLKCHGVTATIGDMTTAPKLQKNGQFLAEHHNGNIIEKTTRLFVIRSKG